MKADRRHELQENTLAHVLMNFPLYVSAYGGRVLLILTLVVLVFVLVRYRNQSKLQQAQVTRISLADARESIAQISQLAGGFGGAAEIANRRALLLNEANNQIDQSLNNADTDALRAESMVARGDLYWTIANLPELPGAVTQPALALPEKRDDLLAKAAQAYEAVLSQYPAEDASRATALFGLAAIAENLGEFDSAQKRYQQISESALPKLYKTMAEQRLSILPMIRKPRRLVAATAPALESPAPTSSVPFLNLPVEVPSQSLPTS